MSDHETYPVLSRIECSHLRLNAVTAQPPAQQINVACAAPAYHCMTGGSAAPDPTGGIESISKGACGRPTSDLNHQWCCYLPFCRHVLGTCMYDALQMFINCWWTVWVTGLGADNPLQLSSSMAGKHCTAELVFCGQFNQSPGTSLGSMKPEATCALWPVRMSNSMLRRCL